MRHVAFGLNKKVGTIKLLDLIHLIEPGMPILFETMAT